eukprot:938264-Prymnesium_polylepis.1
MDMDMDMVMLDGGRRQLGRPLVMRRAAARTAVGGCGRRELRRQWGDAEGQQPEWQLEQQLLGGAARTQLEWQLSLRASGSTQARRRQSSTSRSPTKPAAAACQRRRGAGLVCKLCSSRLPIARGREVKLVSAVQFGWSVRNRPTALDHAGQFERPTALGDTGPFERHE